MSVRPKEQASAFVEKNAATAVGNSEKTVSLYSLMAEIETQEIGDAGARPFSSASLRAGSRVRSMRRAAGLSQRILAQTIGVSQARISEIEAGQGRHGPTWDVMERIADACGWTVSLKPAAAFDEASVVDRFGSVRVIEQEQRTSVLNEMHTDPSDKAFKIQEVGYQLVVTTSFRGSAAVAGETEGITVMLEPVAIAGNQADVDALLASIAAP